MNRIRLVASVTVGAALASVGLVVARQRVARSEMTVPPAVRTDTTVRPLAKGEFNVRMIDVEGSRYAYQVFVPRGYQPRSPWPVLLYLHGAGERGADNLTQLTDGLAPVVREQAATFPAIVVFPQIPLRTRGSQFVPVAIDMLDATMREFNGDPRRVYLTGISFGGATAYSMVYADPTRFAAVVPVAAPIMSGWIPGLRGLPTDSLHAIVAHRLRGMPMWLFHGSEDESAPVADARLFARALENAGAPAHYTEYPGVGHNSWDQAYRTPELFTWLFAQHR